MEITHASFETCLERLTNHAVNDAHIARNDNFHLEINRKEGIWFAMCVSFLTAVLFLINVVLLTTLIINIVKL